MTLTWEYFFRLKDPIGTWQMIDWSIFLPIVLVLFFCLIVFNIFYRKHKKRNFWK